MVKVAFYLENRNVAGIDFRHPQFGNPGCGATEFLMSALPHYLAAHSYCRPIILANRIEMLPEDIPSRRVVDIRHAVHRAREDGCDLFVHRLRRHPDMDFLVLLEELKLPTVAWAQLQPTGPQVRALARSSWVRAIVCVGREQHDSLRDTPVWPKLTCIVNALDLNAYRLAHPPATKPNLVVYLGAMVPQKGFHLLARAWKQVLRRCPSARLAVIGSATLYDTNAELGPWGIAAPAYEQRFMPHLTGTDGRLHPSVTFLGNLGKERKEILCKAAVGVANPSGQTETCPVSALEFQACGTPVVSGAYYGLLDTVRHGYTGLLGRTEDDLAANICSLLEDPARAAALGRNGVCFIRSNHNFNVVAREWNTLFRRILEQKPPPRVTPKRNLHRHFKLLVLVNRPFQMALGHFIEWPSVMEVKSRAADLSWIQAVLTSAKP